jgi:hypothetical protein
VREERVRFQFEIRSLRCAVAEAAFEVRR